MRIGFIIFFLAQITHLSGQICYSVVPGDEQSLEYYKKANVSFKFSDSTQAATKCNEILKSLRQDGYLTPIYEQKWQKDTLNLFITIGQSFDRAYIDPGNADVFTLGMLGYQTNDFNEIWSLRKTRSFLDQLLAFYENNGYPFSRVKLKLLSDANDTIKTILNVSPGPFKSLDSLVVKSETKIPKGYISYHLGLKKGKPYNESKLEETQELADKNGTFKATRSPQVLFTKEKTSVYLYLDQQASNRISGIAGINTNDDGSVFFTGELNLSLNHVFKAAENIEFNWSAPRSGSQQLNLHLDVPFLFTSPLGFLFNFNLYREDTLFSNRDLQVGANVRPNSKTEIALSYQNRVSGNLQGLDNFANVNTKYFLLNTKYNKLNHRFLPTKGVLINVELGQGNRTSNGKKTTQYTTSIEFKGYLDFSKSNKFYAGLKGAGLFNSPLATNELFRIGGVNSLRGFNEQSLFTSQFIYSQLEYRLFLERYTYAFAFADLGLLRNQVPETPTEDFLVGIGLGFSFYTKGGVFSLAVGLGQEEKTTFDINNAKVHLGYITRF